MLEQVVQRSPLSLAVVFYDSVFIKKRTANKKYGIPLFLVNTYHIF